MNLEVTIEKTIHFSCPKCHEPVEARAEATGKLISCPSCGREFETPKPGEKASPWWLMVFFVGMVVLGLAVGIPVGNRLALLAVRARTGESDFQQRQRFEAEAQTALAEQCGKAIVGLQRVVNQDVNWREADPSQWTAEITADFVNPAGGVERTAMPFVFKRYHSPVDQRDHIVCAVDRLKISKNQIEALTRRFNLADPTPGAVAGK